MVVVVNNFVIVVTNVVVVVVLVVATVVDVVLEGRYSRYCYKDVVVVDVLVVVFLMSCLCCP